MESLLQAGRPVRVLVACVAGLLGANAVVLTAQLDRGLDGEPEVVIVEEAPTDTVLIVGADGSTIAIDPTTTEGQAAIAEAQARGDTIVTVPPGDAAEESELDAVAVKPGPPGPPAEARVVQVLDEVTGGLVARTVARLDEDGDGEVDPPTVTTPTAPATEDDEPLVEVTTPPVSVTTPPVSVTTPGVTVTTPSVTVTTPPVTVTTPVTTVTVPTTTVTVPTTTVTVPPVTVTVPSVTVTVPPVTVTVTVPPTTLPDLGL